MSKISRYILGLSLTGMVIYGAIVVLAIATAFALADFAMRPEPVLKPATPVAAPRQPTDSAPTQAQAVAAIFDRVRDQGYDRVCPGGGETYVMHNVDGTWVLTGFRFHYLPNKTWVVSSSYAYDKIYPQDEESLECVTDPTIVK